jgi:hypothetical protein
MLKYNGLPEWIGMLGHGLDGFALMQIHPSR